MTATVAAGLDAHTAELDEQGYTVVPDAAPLELFDRLREVVLRVTAETNARGVHPFDFGPNTSMVYRLLAGDDAVADAVLNPTLTALMTHLLDVGYTVSVVTGSVLHQGSQPGHLHADHQFFPDPFPPQSAIATAIWCCDDFNEANGATGLVPGSHKLLRHPRPDEGLDDVIAVEAPRGSIVVWTGSTWHRSGGRTAPGQRVALHTAFCRPHVQPFESYSAAEVERLVARDPRFVRLLGADLPYHFGGDGPDPTKLGALAATWAAAR